MLVHPDDLEAWRRWHESRHAVRRVVRYARTHVRPPAVAQVDVLTPDDDADLLVAVEATHASVQQAVAAPLSWLDPRRTAIVAPVGWRPPTPFVRHARRTVPVTSLDGHVRPEAVLAAGHYTAIGEAVFALAGTCAARFFVSQHGALTPFAPPLPRGAHLLAWTDADAEFWTCQRPDITVTTTGSQLLWNAGAPDERGQASEGSLTYLGQGHAAELPRSRLVHAALATCRQHKAIYRPHPSEQDAASRAVVAVYAGLGVRVDPGNTPLKNLTTPVVSVFSTGVLEAAARGRDAWVDFPRPPTWLCEFWRRYNMRRIGDLPTPAPHRGTQEPARSIAEIVSA